MKFVCISLGCPKNQVDLDVMVHIRPALPARDPADLAEADVILVEHLESAKTEAIEKHSASWRL